MARIRVFVSSPFAGNFERNTDKAIKYCQYVERLGHAPYAPHLICPQWLNDTIPEERQAGIDIGLAYLDVCEEYWMFLPYGVEEPSAGMKAEETKAKELGIPIKLFIEDKQRKIVRSLKHS